VLSTYTRVAIGLIGEAYKLSQSKEL